MIGYGAFLTAVINFLILAFVIFLMVRAANRMIRRGGRGRAERGRAAHRDQDELELLRRSSRR